MVCIYDSGVGGLSALHALRSAAPMTDVVYLGDTARVPYGTRDAATVLRYARESLDYLAALSPEAILVACGTVSTVALPHLLGRYSVPLVGIVEAGVAEALRGVSPSRIAVLGTEATVRSGTFAAHLTALAPGAEVVSLACPLFVALAEAGLVAPDDPIPRLVAERTLAPLGDLRPEAVLLACTHFPWLAPHLARALPGARLVDCGAAAVATLLPRLTLRGEGTLRFLVTDGVEAFRRVAHRMPGSLTTAEASFELITLAG